MRPNAVRERLRSGARAVNAWVTVDSPYLAEVLSHAGYDAVTVDLQHGMFGLDSAVALLQGVSTGPATPMARCSGLDPREIGKLLDSGAYGLICPSIDSPEQARSFVEACRYPPAGRRSYGPARGLIYGGLDYLDHADDTVMVWAMIESEAAVRQAQSIASTPGLDAVYIGPNDLALDLGLAPGGAAIPDAVWERIESITSVAHAAERWVGCFCADAQQATALLAIGVDLVTPGNDIGLLKWAAAERLGALRDTRAGTAPQEGHVT